MKLETDNHVVAGDYRLRKAALTVLAIALVSAVMCWHRAVADEMPVIRWRGLPERGPEVAPVSPETMDAGIRARVDALNDRERQVVDSADGSTGFVAAGESVSEELPRVPTFPDYVPVD